MTGGIGPLIGPVSLSPSLPRESPVPIFHLRDGGRADVLSSRFAASSLAIPDVADLTRRAKI